MRLVVDTNRIVAALVKDGVSRKIILHFDGELITVGFGKKEIEAHRAEILEKAKISEVDFELIMDKLFQRIVVLDDTVVTAYLVEAEKAMDKIDKADTIFIAAALATKSMIWSDDTHFKKQKKIDVLTTKELMERLGF